MKKSIFFILLILVLLSCSNDNNNEPIDRDPVYNDFPSYFEIPPQGGTFSLRQSSNYDYEIYSCSAISARKKSDKEGDVAFFEEKVQKHETTLVGTDGEDSTPKCNYPSKGKKKASPGVLNPNFFLGLAFSLYWIFLICSSVNLLKSLCFDIYWRYSLLVYSISPFSHEQ